MSPPNPEDFLLRCFAGIWCCDPVQFRVDGSKLRVAGEYHNAIHLIYAHFEGHPLKCSLHVGLWNIWQGRTYIKV
jgi:hypothetical protein